MKIENITGLAIIIFVPLLYVVSCTAVNAKRASGFENVKAGNTIQQVLADLGSPSVREKSGGAPFVRYASKPCTDPCAQRFWYENRLTMDTEAWSVDFNANGREIDKYHWVSP